MFHTEGVSNRLHFEEISARYFVNENGVHPTYESKEFWTLICTEFKNLVYFLNA